MHVPVLLKETLNYLDPKPGDTVIDCTIGGGGHAKAILERTAPDGKLLGIDASREVITHLQKELEPYGERVTLIHGNFRDLKQHAHDRAIHTASGILLDLGVSSDELDDPRRGFSFRQDGPLYMRYGGEGITAAELVNGATEAELAKIIRQYGEERYAGRIAKAVVRARHTERFVTTMQLMQIVREAVPKNYERGRIHPATRTFQALRIAVNDELGALKAVLPQAAELLDVGGRLVVISFHSLEDRIVKRFFREQSKKEFRVLAKRPIQAGEEEIKINPRSRSAKLRVLEKPV